jgi:hypothetical protein
MDDGKTKPSRKPAETKPASPPETKPAAIPETKGEGLDLQREETAGTVAAMEEAIPLTPMARKTLRGDLRDAMMEVIKRFKGYREMLEGEQRDIIGVLDHAADAFVDKAARLIAEEGRSSVLATVESINLKDGMKVTVKAAYSLDAVSLLADAANHAVVIMRPKAELAKGQRKPPTVKPDQASLIPEDDSDLAGASDPVKPEGDNAELAGDGSGEALPPVEDGDGEREAGEPAEA